MKDDCGKGDNGNHLVCANCQSLLDCDWMGISLDEDDECNYGGRHCADVRRCDCEELVNITQ